MGGWVGGARQGGMTILQSIYSKIMSLCIIYFLAGILQAPPTTLILVTDIW